jgi:hypothetical protein
MLCLDGEYDGMPIAKVFVAALLVDHQRNERILSNDPREFVSEGQNTAAVPHLAGDPGSNRERPPFVLSAPV